jgi:hypothetical protein
MNWKNGNGLQWLRRRAFGREWNPANIQYQLQQHNGSQKKLAATIHVHAAASRNIKSVV